MVNWAKYEAIKNAEDHKANQARASKAYRDRQKAKTQAMKAPNSAKVGKEVRLQREEDERNEYHGKTGGSAAERQYVKEAEEAGPLSAFDSP